MKFFLLAHTFPTLLTSLSIYHKLNNPLYQYLFSFCLPQCIMGAMRAGTTAVLSLLSPQPRAWPGKVIGWFSRDGRMDTSEPQLPHRAVRRTRRMASAEVCHLPNHATPYYQGRRTLIFCFLRPTSDFLVFAAVQREGEQWL